MKTRAITFLESRKINFEVLHYEHEVKGAKFAAEVLNVPLEQMIKSIVVKESGGAFYFCLMPGDLEISVKKAAKLIGAKGIEMAKQEEAERVTGYLVGGISPFGSKKNLTVILNSSLERFETVYINAGARGIILKLKLDDLKKLLNPMVGDISFE